MGAPRTQSVIDEGISEVEYDRLVAKIKCQRDHLDFTRYFFLARQRIPFIVNWHHRLMSDVVDDVINGRRKNVIITVSPGSSKTELVVVNFIARGLALNPWCRFLHLSGSDSLASLNSATAREIIQSDEYQALWPLKIADDSSAKKRWNVMVDGQQAGGVYATSLGGQVTGFRAGHMTDGFFGCLIVDDPIKPEEAFSKTALEKANRKLLTTVRSRKATPNTPMILIMQRIAEMDPAGFIEAGALGPDWSFVRIPAVLDEKELGKIPGRYRSMINPREEDIREGRFSYWQYKEPIDELIRMERGEGMDLSGNRISKHVFSSQYMQSPVAIGGNIIHGKDFGRYTALPKIKWRKIFADTAQKTKERNDYSVFEEWGLGIDGKIYLLDLIRGRWEAPELQRRAIAFWAAGKARDVQSYGQLRAMPVEDKSSGTGLIQTLRLPPYNIPVVPVERDRDKLTRVKDILAYIEIGVVCIPEAASFTSEFIKECEAFTADDTHDFDDQIDPLVDAVNDMLQAGNKIKQWEELGRPFVQQKPQTSTEKILQKYRK